MDFEAFVKKLDQRLKSVLFAAGEGESLSTVASSFNQGAVTMYNYAMVAAYELQAESQGEVV